MENVKKIIFVSVIVWLLAACGGGSSSGTSASAVSTIQSSTPASSGSSAGQSSALASSTGHSDSSSSFYSSVTVTSALDISSSSGVVSPSVPVDEGTFSWQSDNGDGTFTNPILYADYSDPDIIRVGSDFYMTASTFVNSPGLPILHSKDMVNWKIIGHAAATVNGGATYNMMGGTAYEGGFWAPSLRHHNGVFYLAVQPTFGNGRIYYANDPAGQWNYHELDRTIYDPGLFFDTDGKGYIVSGGHSLSLMVLNNDYSSVVQQIDDIINTGSEGSHLVKRGQYYYLFNAKPSVWPFQLLSSRTTDLMNGPWETRVALTATTGGHQGAIVDVNDNDEWFGFVHQDSGSIGRMPRIGPVFWENDWPIFGTPNERDVISATYSKPVSGQTATSPVLADNFNGPNLGLQWAWNHNPDPDRWSLLEREGFLRLRPLKSDGFWTARNTLTQKIAGPISNGVIRVDVSHMQPGDVVGFGTFGKVSAHVTVNVDSTGRKYIGSGMINDKVGNYISSSGVLLESDIVYLRADVDVQKNVGISAYSTDGQNFTTVGGQFQLMFGFGSTWQGTQFAIFSYNTITDSSSGYVDIDSFSIDDSAPLITAMRGRPVINAERTTFVGDNGQLLRGPYSSTEWTPAAPYDSVARVKELGFNMIHLYAESFDPLYPASGSTAPGYAVAEIDKFVQMTRELGLYLVITIGNGAYNGNYNKQWIIDFWSFYAGRYANDTHVIYEIQNEPVAWGPSYASDTATPPGAIDMEVEAFNVIRNRAPDTPVLVFSYSVMDSEASAEATLIDIEAFHTKAGRSPQEIWSNAAIGFHGYAGWAATTKAVAKLIAEGYPLFMTEFISSPWDEGHEGVDVELTAELERLKVSWANFLYIPPAGVSIDVTRAEAYSDLINKAGFSWTPDYGNWPIARSPYHDGRPFVAGIVDEVTQTIHASVRIEAEHFDRGGEGVTYHDLDRESHGSALRPDEGVDVFSIGPDQYAVGRTEVGEWLEYTVLVTTAGYYDLNFHYSAASENGAVNIIFNGKSKGNNIALSATGSIDSWATKTHPVFLEKGRRVLRIEVSSGNFNLDWMELIPSSGGSVADGAYKLVNRNSGLVLTKAGNAVVQTGFNGSPEQLWNLKHLGAGQYRISSSVGNENWNSFADAVDLVWWWSVNAEHQRYVIRPTGDGYFRLLVGSTGFTESIENSSKDQNATVVHSHRYTGDAGQQWAIQAADSHAFPTWVVASYISSTAINVQWAPTDGAVSYNVKRTTGDDAYTTVATGITDLNYIDTTVTPGVSYRYVVSAVNADGIESLVSVAASAARLHTYLSLDESSGAIASDSSGNGWNATLENGPVWTSGIKNNGLTLDGNDDYVSLPTGIVADLEEFTFAAWVKLNIKRDWMRIFDFGTGISHYMYLTTSFWEDLPRFSMRSDIGEFVVAGNEPLPIGEWVHIAVTLGDSTAILYINGEEVGRNANIPVTPASLGFTTQNYLGKSQWPDPHFDGEIDEVRIYSGVLSPSDIQVLYVNP